MGDLTDIAARLKAGDVVPYLGPDVLTLGGPVPVPSSLPDLAKALTAKVAVPGRIRHNVWASAQYVESHKHRVTLKRTMQAIFAEPVAPTPLHRYLAELELPLVVDMWYDGAMATALADQPSWGQAQGVSHAEHREDWWHAISAKGEQAKESEIGGWDTLLYKPWGSVAPAGNFVVSDADFVEVLTEIDIQSPIPKAVQDRRSGRDFLFLGCRFDDQTARSFAQAIMKRSGARHFAIIDGELTPKEVQFLERQGITRIDVPLAEAAEALMAA